MDEYEALRLKMVDTQIRRRGVRDARVLEAMRRVPRHEFVPEKKRHQAYADHPVPIGEAQTISQPFMVAAMTEILSLTGTERVLEIGTGSGYQTAILAECAAEVYTIERSAILGAHARTTLTTLGYTNVEYLVCDGTRGWPERAPFDGLIVTAGAPEPPPAIVAQIADPGILVAPVGERGVQDLISIRRKDGKNRRIVHFKCAFVPLIGVEGFPRLMLQDIWTWLTDSFIVLGYPGIFGLMALESSFFPFPSEVVVPPGGALAREGSMSLPIVILVGILGSMAGALFNYWLAVKLGRPFCLKYGKYFLLSEKKFVKSEEFFRRHGEIGTFVGRLVPGVRQIISFPAGLARMSLWRFCLFTALGSGIWVTVLALIGYAVGRDLEVVKRHSAQVLLWMAPAILVLIVVYIWWDRKKRRPGASEAASTDGTPDGIGAAEEVEP